MAARPVGQLATLGDVRAARGDLAGALQAYQQTLAITQKLAGADPGNTAWQYDLSLVLGTNRHVRHEQPDRAPSLRARQDNPVELAGSDPGNVGWQRDLSISWERIGGIRERQGDKAGALEAWRRALAVSLPLAKAHPDSVDLVTTPVPHIEGVARNLPADDGPGREALAAEAGELLALLRPLAAAGRLDARRADWADYLELAELRGEAAPRGGA